MQEIEQLADRVAILRQGSVMVIDMPAALKLKYNSESLEDVFLRVTGRSSLNDEETPAA